MRGLNSRRAGLTFIMSVTYCVTWVSYLPSLRLSFFVCYMQITSTLQVLGGTVPCTGFMNCRIQTVGCHYHYGGSGACLRPHSAPGDPAGEQNRAQKKPARKPGQGKFGFSLS